MDGASLVVLYTKLAVFCRLKMMRQGSLRRDDSGGYVSQEFHKKFKVRLMLKTGQSILQFTLVQVLRRSPGADNFFSQLDNLPHPTSSLLDT
jgi:hypothetical protein